MHICNTTEIRIDTLASFLLDKLQQLLHGSSQIYVCWELFGDHKPSVLSLYHFTQPSSLTNYSGVVIHSV